MRQLSHLLYFLPGIFFSTAGAQQAMNRIDLFSTGDIRVTIDRPSELKKNREMIIVFYALPNGNTTEQTMGRKMKPGDDWHFDIQHIAAQTRFIRGVVKRKNIIVIYLENQFLSWPYWKQQHPDFRERIPVLVDSIQALIPGRKKSICLNGHSGGGSFIFGYLAGVKAIPSSVKRICFLDSNYGYDSSYYPLLSDWLRSNNSHMLNVFAYNDSVALYNGKPLVSATGGTWYRAHLMLRDFSREREFTESVTDSIRMFKSRNGQVQFFLKPNFNHGIYHTQQVELNGFVHSLLCGTKYDSRKYRYYEGRAYADMIE